jgi:hypothetical protein
MVDEAHERSLNIDFVMGLLKQAQIERRQAGLAKLKIVITSATIDKEKFAKYFGEAPVIEVPGRKFPVEVRYEREDVDDYAKAAAERVKQIVNSGEQGDVLIFMPGEQEIKVTMKAIDDMNLSGIEVMPLYGAMKPEDQKKVFLKNPRRKVIVATNIAETSITIDGVRHVIDSGLIKQKQFNKNTGIEALKTIRHAQGGCDQRKGRAGRTAPGTCYRLYTEEEFNGLAKDQTPEITRSNIDHVVLAMTKMGIADIRDFDFIDRPTTGDYEMAFKSLKLLGALDEEEKLTPMGEKMSELPLSPELARMVLEAQKYGCTESVTTIAAMFGQSVFIGGRPDAPDALKREAAQAAFKKSGSDFLAMLEVWKQFAKSGCRERWQCEKWARERFLNGKVLFEVQDIRAQLLRELKQQGIAGVDNNATDENIQKSVAAGLIQNLMVPAGRYGYKKVSDNGHAVEIMIHPGSAAFSRRSEMMIGADVMTTSKTFARKCQTVNPEWLPEIAPQLLSELQRTSVYDPQLDRVEVSVDYGFKGSYRHLVSRKEVVTDENIIKNEFAKALAEGRVDLPCVKHNAEVLEALNKLQARSGGLVEVPKLADYYNERLGGAKSRAEAIYIDEHLRLKLGDYCGEEMMDKLEREMPDKVSVKGRELAVVYGFQQAQPDAYYESERIEKYTATIDVPADMLFTLQLADIPAIGQNGRPSIIYSCSDGYNPMNNADLEALKADFDRRRLNSIWSMEFRKPESVKVVVGRLEGLPSLESLGSKPIPYAKDYKSDDVLAYPGFVVEQRYDYQISDYVFSYRVDYWQTKPEADESSVIAKQNRLEEIAKEQRKVERETLLAPVKARFESMRGVMSTFGNDQALYGLSNDEFSRLYNGWYAVESNLRGNDADPKAAIAMMDDIEQTTKVGRAEAERKRELLGEVKSEMTAMSARMGKLTERTYKYYGLRDEQYHAIQEKWNKANAAITPLRYSYAQPDPDLARRLMREVESMVPTELGEMSPEQEHLMDLLFGPSDYVQMVQVRGGKITSVGVPSELNNMRAVGKTMAKRGGGEDYLVQGGNLVSLYTGGSSGRQYKLTDGDWIFEDGGNTAIKVEAAPDTLGGYKALQLVYSEHYQGNPYIDPRKNANSGRVATGASSYMSAGDSGGFGGNNPFAGALKAVKGKPLPAELEKPQSPRLELPEKLVEAAVPVPDVKSAVVELLRIPVEKQPMTEYTRGILEMELRGAKMILDDVRAVPEPTDVKMTNAAKISKARQTAAERKADLNKLSRELQDMEDGDKADGLVRAMRQSAEKVAKDMAFLRNEAQTWPKQFEMLLVRLTEIADTYGETITDEHLKKLILLAKRKGSVDDISDSDLEAIFS